MHIGDCDPSIAGRQYLTIPSLTLGLQLFPIAAHRSSFLMYSEMSSSLSSSIIGVDRQMKSSSVLRAGGLLIAGSEDNGDIGKSLARNNLKS